MKIQLEINMIRTNLWQAALITMGALLFVLGAKAESVSTSPEFDPQKLEAIGAIVDGLYEDGLIPNYVVDIQRRGETIYHIERGKTQIGAGEEVNNQTIYAIASMTKPIVSTAVLRLIQDLSLIHI